MIENYLWAEQPIIDWLRAELPEVRGVFSVADIDEAPDRAQVAPSVQVWYAGSAPANDPRQAAYADVWRQQWAAMVVIRNVRTAPEGEADAARMEAGPLVTRVIRLLHGYRPAEFLDRLKLVAAPLPFKENGVWFHPLIFETVTLIEGDPRNG